MRSVQRTTFAILAVAGVVVLATGLRAGEPPASARPSAWPEITATARPWAYWWWMGSAVDRENLARELARYRKAGMGGLHIVPIYGAQGYEDRYIEYLSPRWLAMLDYAVTEARRLGMGVDMTMGTGWCFGGPHVADRDANARVALERSSLVPGQKPRVKTPRADVQAAVAFDAQGKPVELTDKVAPDGTIDWAAPGPGWTLFVVSQKPSGRKVKRAAPGGAGWMLNPFSGRAMRAHAAWFDRALKDYRGAMPRAFYHDSYEYQCDWSDDLLAEFARRRGYRLQTELPALFGQGDPDRVARVKADYRRTVSDMMTDDFTRTFVDWAHGKGCLTVDQAHGSPGNLLDLYGTSDIPETEFFRFDRNPLVAKFASSAAHVMGRRLISSETGTWLDEHFHVTLGQLKPLVDGFFASGINHVFYHGTCYSPDDASWPGWLFYASTQMNPRNALWHDAPALCAYIAHCQSVLQAGAPDNDVLVYWPIDDLWHDPTGLAKTMTVHQTAWLTDQPIGRTARWLWDHGYLFDYVSDRQLQLAKVEQGRIAMPGGAYRTVLVPPCEHVPLQTMEKLVDLAHAGAAVLFEDHVPRDVPGLGNLEARRTALRKLVDEKLAAGPGGGKATVGTLTRLLAGVPREPVVDHAGMLVIRRRLDDGRFTFLANQDRQFTGDAKTEPIDGWITLGTPAQSAIVMDPMTGRTGRAAIRHREGRAEVYLQLAPGESIILRTFTDRDCDAPQWEYLRTAGDSVPVAGTWSVKFLEGGPKLPGPFETSKLASWTALGDAEARRFAGTARYAITFDAPARSRAASHWILDLGRVCHSARVRLNGRDLGTLFARPFRVQVPANVLKSKGNVLSIEVTNLSANRIRDLDLRGVRWRIFHDINFANVDYRPFDASKWPLADSGLLGPATLRPAEVFAPQPR